MKKFILLLLSLQCSLYNIASAQNPGDLDQSFGSGGKIITPLSPWSDIALQPDGKVLAVGEIIARYNTNGLLDASFSNDGVDSLKIDDTVFKCSAVGIQADGKILVAAIPVDINAYTNDFRLIRYDADGSRDSSFGIYGVVRTDLNSGSDDHAYQLVVQTDGKIIVSGASNSTLALSRYHSDGTPDSTFDGDGKLVINTMSVYVSNSWTHVNYLKLQADDKILVGSGGVLARLNPDGSLDNSFGTNGVVGLSQTIRDMAVQPDGKIVLSGGYTVFAIVRLNTNGSADNSFGNGGTVITDWAVFGCYNPHQVATSVVLQPDGRILAGGYNVCGYLSGHGQFVLIRYNENGSLDSNFNFDGQVETSFSVPARSFASAITPDFKIVLAGYDYSLAGPERGFMARYHLGWLLDVNTVSGNDEGFVVSPNPTVDWINIEAAKVENGIWHLEIWDITGRPVTQEDIVATGGSIQKKVSLNGLPAGVYLLQLDNGKKKTVSRVVKY